MSKRKEIDEHVDEIRVGVTIHPDTMKKYEKCRQCFDGDCKTCEFGLNPDGTVDAMASFLRPRYPYPNI